MTTKHGILMASAALSFTSAGVYWALAVDPGTAVVGVGGHHFGGAAASVVAVASSAVTSAMKFLIAVAL